MRALLLAAATFAAFALVSTPVCFARTARPPSPLQAIDAEIAKAQQAIQTHDAEIAALKRDAASLQVQAGKIGEVAPQLFALAGKGAHGGAQLRAVLANQLAQLGASLSPRSLSALANAIAEGGQGAMAIAMVISFAIAEASAEAKFGQRSRTSALASLDQAAVSCHGSKLGLLAGPPPASACIAILEGLAARPRAIHLSMSIASTAAGLPAAKGVAVFLSGVDAQATAQISEINAVIEHKKVEIKSLKQMIVELTKQKAALEKEAQRRRKP